MDQDHRRAPDGAAQWRGWVQPGGTAGRAVTSARLGPSARPRSRLFPKTRSWFALDAPLELLSPLAVARVLLAACALLWPLVALTTPGPFRDRVAMMALGATTAVVWVGLLSLRVLGRQATALVAVYADTCVVVLVGLARGSADVAAFTAFLVPFSVFVALFLGRRAMVLQQGLVTVGLWVALTPHDGVGGALALAAVTSLALSLAPAAVLVLARSARRHDVVDPDTGLPNGFGLARRLAADARTCFLVAVVGLDGIGNAREAMGYQVGTELLRRAVEDLGQVLPADAVIGRVSGDELVVTLALEEGERYLRAGRASGGGPDAPDHAPSDPEHHEGPPPPVAEAGRVLAETLVRAVAAGQYRVDAVDVHVRANVGLAAAPWDGTAVSELVRRASISARRAADAGVAMMTWDGDREALTATDLEVAGDLAGAAARGELSLAYQPQIDAATGAMVAVEALLRWDSPVHGRVPPGRFVTLAERSGLIDGLTEWVVGEALDAQARWRKDSIQLSVSVNLSAKSLPVPGLANWILDQVEDRGLPSSCLTVEVTETAVADPAQALAVLQPLHDRGIRISLDDFGTGYTSLAQLPALPLDELKIDQCFVLQSATSSADEAIVHAIGELAHRLGLKVVAEGVETAVLARRLTDMGIDILQGYHFARPVPEAELLALVRRTADGGSWPKMIVPNPGPGVDPMVSRPPTTV